MFKNASDFDKDMFTDFENVEKYSGSNQCQVNLRTDKLKLLSLSKRPLRLFLFVFRKEVSGTTPFSLLKKPSEKIVAICCSPQLNCVILNLVYRFSIPFSTLNKNIGNAFLF